MPPRVGAGLECATRIPSTWSGNASVSSSADLLHHPARARLLVLRGLRDVLNRRDGDALERLRAIRPTLLRDPLADRGQQLVAVREAVRVREEARVGGELGPADRRQSCAKRRSFAAAIISSPSLVAKTSYGAISGKAVPERPGATPVRSASVSW